MQDTAILALNTLVVCEQHALFSVMHELRLSCTIPKLMKLNNYLQGRIKIDATLCEYLIDFRKFTEQEFGGSFPSFITFMDHLLASSRFFAIQARVMLCFALFLLYLNLTIEIY